MRGRIEGVGRLCVALIALAWAPLAAAQSLGSFVSPGPLAAAHAELEGITQCFECHSVGAGVSAGKCLVCHEGVQRQIDLGTGFHADKATACESCHPDHRGLGFDMVHLDTEAFDHAETGFALDGAHADVDCGECHPVEGSWTGLEPACRSCHEDPHGSAAGRAFLGECAECHDETRWAAVDPMRAWFDHTDPAHVDYALHGQHRDVACEGCHAGARFVPTAADRCEDCHEDPHRQQFAPRACDACHTVERAAFALRDFDHTRTRWPLTLAHRDVSCEACHGDGRRGRYVGLPHERCETCHQDPHRGEFRPRDCDACHSPDLPSFALAGFDHDATDFPLVGAHREVSCAACHGEGVDAAFTSVVAEGCHSCHEDPHEDRFAPRGCAECHEDGTWEVESFDHDLSRFPLTGAHREVGCEACHGEAEARILAPLAAATCADCHAEDDPHRTAATATCAGCHETAAWETVQFDHGGATGFALEGGHAGPACAACHEAPGFDDADAACAACHGPDRPRDHFEGECGDCHLVAAWRPATFGDGADHGATGFALHGAHAQVACEDCHGGRASVGPFCADCHEDDDPHRNQLGNSCDACHAEGDWFTIAYTHAVTGWPLRGAHRLAACQDCHATGWVGTPTACRRCHAAEEPRDRLHSDPLVGECEDCHRPYDWDGARWPHGGDR